MGCNIHLQGPNLWIGTRQKSHECIIVPVNLCLVALEIMLLWKFTQLLAMTYTADFHKLYNHNKSYKTLRLLKERF